MTRGECRPSLAGAMTWALSKDCFTCQQSQAHLPHAPAHHPRVSAEMDTARIVSPSWINY